MNKMKNNMVIFIILVMLIVSILPNYDAFAKSDSNNWEKAYLDFLENDKSRFKHIVSVMLKKSVDEVNFYEKQGKYIDGKSYINEEIIFVNLKNQEIPQMAILYEGIYSYDGTFVIYDFNTKTGKVEEIYRFITNRKRNGVAVDNTIYESYIKDDYTGLVLVGDDENYKDIYFELKYNPNSKKIYKKSISKVPKNYSRIKDNKNHFKETDSKYKQIGKYLVVYYTPENLIKYRLNDYKKNIKQDLKKEDIKIKINDELLTMDRKPVNENGRILVPMRAIFEFLGAEIYWDQSSKTVKAVYEDTIIELKIDDEIAKINNEKIRLDVPAKILNGNTMVPTRFIAESLGAKVDWDQKNRMVLIDWENK